MQKGEGAESHHLTGFREEGASVSTRQQADKGASRISHPDKIPESIGHYQQGIIHEQAS
jgi:hypothetical protein